LVDAGIVLETEVYWYYKMYIEGGEWQLSQTRSTIPAPCMAEVWRELPGDYISFLGNEYNRIDYLEVRKDGNKAIAAYGIKMNRKSDNPTDALVELLVWVKGEKKCQK